MSEVFRTQVEKIQGDSNVSMEEKAENLQNKTFDF